MPAGIQVFDEHGVSVPIRGLFNLTVENYEKSLAAGYESMFPSPLGDYLI